MTPEIELSLYRHLHEVGAYLRQSRDATAALRYSLRATRDFFEADEACLAVLPPGGEQADVVFVLPYGSEWDRTLLTSFLRGEKPAVPPSVILAKVARRERRWGVLGLRRVEGEFGRGAFRALSRICTEISEQVQRIDRERLLEVRSRIDGKLVQQVPPKDLFYQVLDGLRSLTAYDHSSALLIHERESGQLRLVAEQIAWSKRKSLKIGLKRPLAEGALSFLGEGIVYGFDRTDGQWTDWPGQQAVPLAELLDYNDGDAVSAGGSEAEVEAAGAADPGEHAEPGEPAERVEPREPVEPREHAEVSDPAERREHAEPRERTMLCAPLATREGPLGVLKVAALHAGSFGPYEANLLKGFVGIASVAIQNSQRSQTLQARMMEAVRKHAIVDLARGVSHDVNNALGAVIPLVQQMSEDARSGRAEPALLEKDLEQIESSLQVCRRIFSGMLGFARSSARSGGHADVRLAVDRTCGVLGDSIARHGIGLEVQVPESLPAVKGGQGDLEQLLLNLLTNARDATPEGGRISVRAAMRDARLEMVVQDTGCGIPPDRLSKIQEPFFTTKPHGAGLGLSTCRWIIWEMRGELKFESKPGEGTSVTVRLPIEAADRGAS